MTIDDASRRHSELSEQITGHRRRYYEQDAPTISDGEFDALMAELIGLEAAHPELVTPDSPTQQVGGRASASFAPVVREAKAVLTSAWSLARGNPNEPVRIAEIAAARFRAPDPWYHVANGIVSRRLSPNNRKIEASAIDDRLHGRRMLKTMGLELANIHASNGDAGRVIAKDLQSRKADWLRTAAETATKAVQHDYREFTRRAPK